MSIETALYLAYLLPNIAILLMTLAVVTLAVVVVGTIFCLECDKFPPMWSRILKITIPTSIFLILVSVLIPSENTIYLMMGTNLTKQAVASETGQKIQKIVDQKLDELLQSAVPTKQQK